MARNGSEARTCGFNVASRPHHEKNESFFLAGEDCTEDFEDGVYASFREYEELHRKLAVKWYRNAADQGDPEAQISLSNLYREGKGVGQSDEEAAKWFQRAVEQKKCDSATSEQGSGLLVAPPRIGAKIETLGPGVYYFKRPHQLHGYTCEYTLPPGVPCGG